MIHIIRQVASADGEVDDSFSFTRRRLCCPVKSLRQQPSLNNVDAVAGVGQLEAAYSMTRPIPSTEYRLRYEVVRVPYVRTIIGLQSTSALIESCAYCQCPMHNNAFDRKAQPLCCDNPCCRPMWRHHALPVIHRP